MSGARKQRSRLCDRKTHKPTKPGRRPEGAITLPPGQERRRETAPTQGRARTARLHRTRLGTCPAVRPAHLQLGACRGHQASTRTHAHKCPQSRVHNNPNLEPPKVPQPRLDGPPVRAQGATDGELRRCPDHGSRRGVRTQARRKHEGLRGSRRLRGCRAWAGGAAKARGSRGHARSRPQPPPSSSEAAFVESYRGCILDSQFDVRELRRTKFVKNSPIRMFNF